MIEKLKQELSGIKIDEPMSNHTTFKIGGPAKYFYLAKDSDSLLKAVKLADKLGINYFILGWGSNLLVSDDGFNGLIIKASGDNYRIENQEIIVESGVNLSRLVGVATQAKLSGLEFAAGIPGTVGGAARGNAGAYGRGFGDLVVDLDIYQDGELKKISQQEMAYSYRDSYLKAKPGVILSVRIRLEPGDPQKIQSELVANIKHRNQKLPIEPSAGCIFKNIDLSQVKIDEKKIIKALDITKEEWQDATKYGKLPVSYITDKLGFKGKKIGGCQVSEKHAAFFVNIGQAKAEHVMMLISDIKMHVRNELLIQLQEEIQYLGF